MYQWLLRFALLSASTALRPQHPLNQGFAALDTTDVYSLHRKLVEIPSISDSEHAIGEFLASHLRAQNFNVEKHPVRPFYSLKDDEKHQQRFNLLAYPSSSSSNGTRVLLTAQQCVLLVDSSPCISLDTVPPFIPYSYNSTTHQISGRGSVDAKACIAAQVTAAISLLQSGAVAPSSLSLLYVVGEELGGDGMRAFNSIPHPAYETVIFGEPTDLKLASGHKGNLAFTVTAIGKGGHSGYPWLGENANSMLLPALLALDHLPLPNSKKYGNTTLNIGKMVGGEASNVIASSAYADIQVRIAGGEPEVSQSLIVDGVKEVDERLRVHFWSQGYGPVNIDHDVEGFETMTVNYGTDIPWLDGDHKRYLFGPGSILDAHSDHEHLSLQDLAEAVEGYKKLILAALGR
ncbi:MAG: hypothetical protein Q9176_006252 [Flavoplaca citrina]